MTRAVVFDRDGVLARFDLGSARAQLEGLLPFDLAALEGELRRAAPGEPVVDERSERAWWAAFWGSLCDRHGLGAEVRARLLAFEPRSLLRAHEDAAPAIAAARARGWRIGVLSNFGLLELEASLRALDLRVDVALSAARIGAAKPAPEAYEAIARGLGVPVGDCLLVDDRAEHVAGARAVGMRAELLDRRSAGLLDLLVEPSHGSPRGATAP